MNESKLYCRTNSTPHTEVVEAELPPGSKIHYERTFMAVESELTGSHLRVLAVSDVYITMPIPGRPADRESLQIYIEGDRDGGLAVKGLRELVELRGCMWPAREREVKSEAAPAMDDIGRARFVAESYLKAMVNGNTSEMWALSHEAHKRVHRTVMTGWKGGVAFGVEADEYVLGPMLRRNDKQVEFTAWVRSGRLWADAAIAVIREQGNRYAVDAMFPVELSYRAGLRPDAVPTS